MKPTLVYFNSDCFTDTDVTVLRYLSNEFQVVWFYLYESLFANEMRYSPLIVKDYAEKYGITLEVVDPKVRRRSPKNLYFYWKIARKINSYKPDIVYCCSIFPFWMLTYRFIKCPNKVFGVHDAVRHSYKKNRSLQWMNNQKEKWFKCFPLLLTFSASQHDLLKQVHGYDSEMVGMSFKCFGKSSNTPSPIETGIKLLFFGSIILYKGLDLLINALEELRTEGINNLTLTIAGKGAFWKDCQPLIKTTELYKLKVRFIENDEIPDLMSSHHFLVLPYRNVTQSGPLVTALGYGLPVIAPELGSFLDYFDNKTAILYPQGALKESLRCVSTMTQREYQTIRNNLAIVRENYTEERIAQNYIRAFKSILE